MVALVYTYMVGSRRVHHRILTDNALAGWYRPRNNDIQAINRCRLYLQIERLSDICPADGLILDPRLQAQRHLTEYDQASDHTKGLRGQYGEN
jgi:hypothetical protein